MVSVDDYSVYVTEIKTCLRAIEDACLKAEVGTTENELVSALAILTKLEFANYRLNDLLRDKLKKVRNK